MDLLTLGIVGAVVSGIVGYIKARFGTKGWKSVLSLVVVSLVGGFGFWLLQGSEFWVASPGGRWLNPAMSCSSISFIFTRRILNASRYPESGMGLRDPPSISMTALLPARKEIDASSLGGMSSRLSSGSTMLRKNRSSSDSRALTAIPPRSERVDPAPRRTCG